MTTKKPAQVSLTKELTQVTSRLTKMQDVVHALVVKDDASQVEATNILAGIKSIAKQIKDFKDLRIKPINDALKLLRSDYKPVEDYCKEKESIVKGKMIVYHREQEAIRLKKEEALAKRVEKGTMKVETAEKKLEEAPEVQNKVEAEKGSATFRKVKNFEVTDLSKLPIEYHTANTVLIRQEMRSGRELPGVRYFEEDQLAGGL